MLQNKRQEKKTEDLMHSFRCKFVLVWKGALCRGLKAKGEELQCKNKTGLSRLSSVGLKPSAFLQ